MMHTDKQMPILYVIELNYTYQMLSICYLLIALITIIYNSSVHLADLYLYFSSPVLSLTTLL